MKIKNFINDLAELYLDLSSKFNPSIVKIRGLVVLINENKTINESDYYED